MAILSIDLGALAGTAEEMVDQIAIGHLRARIIPLAGGQVGLRNSPGIVVVLPLNERADFAIDGELVQLPVDRALLLSGESSMTLVSVEKPEEDGPRDDNLEVIEINATINRLSRLPEQCECPNLLSNQDSKTMAGLFHELVFKDKSVQLPPGGNDIALHLIAARIVSLLLASASDLKPSLDNPNHYPQLHRLKKYLLMHLGERVTTADMASHLKMSRAYFCRKAKSLLGEAPAAYLRRIRLERSMEMLEHTSKSIESITAEVGYADRFNFSKEFKKQHGISPVQYRKERKGSPHMDTSQPQALFDRHKYEEALSLCEKALLTTGPRVNEDHLQYLQGRCLAALGRSDEAHEAWGKLQAGPYAWQSRLQSCRLHFKRMRFRMALGVLSKLWEQAEGKQHNDVISIWTDQATDLIHYRIASAIRRYLDFRKTYFVSDQQSMTIAIRCCRKICDYMSFLDHCPGNKDMAMQALNLSACFDEFLEKYRLEAPLRMLASALVKSGRYSEVLNLDPDVPGYSSEALIAEGRHKEAIQRYPDDCAWAYLEMGEYEKALECSSGPCLCDIYALYGLGRLKELETYDVEGSYYWHVAQQYSRPWKLLQVDYFETHFFIPATRLQLAFQKGLTKADVMSHIEAIPRIDSEDFWAEENDHTSILLRLVIPILLGGENSLSHDYEIVKRELRYFSSQILYHDLAFLLGEIDIQAWGRQPYQLDRLFCRGLFVQALQQDLIGQRERAVRGYETFMANSTFFRSGHLISQQFAKWRLREFEESGPGPDCDRLHR